jgi:hypothetical protein
MKPFNSLLLSVIRHFIMSTVDECTMSLLAILNYVGDLHFVDKHLPCTYGKATY